MKKHVYIIVFVAATSIPLVSFGSEEPSGYRFSEGGVDKQSFSYYYLMQAKKVWPVFCEKSKIAGKTLFDTLKHRDMKELVYELSLFML